MTKIDICALAEELEQRRENLRLLRKRASMYDSLHVPPSLALQIEAEENEIHRITQAIDDWERGTGKGCY